MTNRIKKRRRLLINPQFQFRFIGYMAMSGLLMLLLFFLANKYFFWKFTEKGLAMGMPPNHMFFKFLEEQRDAMIHIYLVIALAVFTVNVIYGLYVSNRIAGPIFRIQRHIEEWFSGKKETPLVFRKNDNFHELADMINRHLVVESHSESDKKR